MVNLAISLLGGNGDTITFDGSDGYYLTTGFSGLGIPTTDVVISNSAGDGGTWRSTRRGVRTLDLPITVVDADRATVEAKLRRLATALSDRVTAPKLLATYSDGTSYDLEVHYTGGAETTFGEDAGDTYCRWVITVQAPDPYWTSREAVTFSLAASTATRGLLAPPAGTQNALGRLIVQSSQVLGSFVVDNIGEVDAYPVWTLEGTASSVTITKGGVGFTYTEAMTSGSKIIIDTKNATVRDTAGTNKYANLSTAPKLFALPSGQSTLSITAVGSDSTTKISGYYLPRREVLF